MYGNAADGDVYRYMTPAHRKNSLLTDKRSLLVDPVPWKSIVSPSVRILMVSGSKVRARNPPPSWWLPCSHGNSLRGISDCRTYRTAGACIDRRYKLYVQCASVKIAESMDCSGDMHEHSHDWILFLVNDD